MKTIKISLVLLLMTLGFNSVNAQNKIKIGVINISDLLALMPEYDSLTVAYQAKSDQMQKDLEQLYSEYQTKQTSLSQDQANLTEMMKSIRTQELDDLQKRIQGFEGGAQTELNNFIQEKQAPILDKIRTAVKAVALENGYTQVINNTQEQVLYYDDASDILPLVKKKMNLKDKPVPPKTK